MRIRISFDKAQVVERGDGFVEIECKPFEQPKLPAFVHVYNDRNPDAAKHGYYLVVSGHATLRASKYD